MYMCNYSINRTNNYFIPFLLMYRLGLTRLLLERRELNLSKKQIMGEDERLMEEEGRKERERRNKHKLIQNTRTLIINCIVIIIFVFNSKCMYYSDFP